MKAVDPLQFGRLLWPNVRFYKEQQETIYSVLQNRKTFVPAANKMGKDFVAGFIVLWFFLTRPRCRIVTTSVAEGHLAVLWDEIHRFIRECNHPLTAPAGPLVVNQRALYKVEEGVPRDNHTPMNYVLGMVAERGAKMQGHHVPESSPENPCTLFVCDEASGVDDEYYRMADTWAHRMLVIGNPWPCENFFKRAVKGDGVKDPGGDLPSPSGPGLYRKVIKIRAEDSPNIRWAQDEISRGLKPSGKVLVPGVKSYSEYLEDRAFWDEMQQCVCLDAEFYEGGQVLMFPPEWLNLAERAAKDIAGHHPAKALAVDSAAGGDNTSWAVVGRLGLIELHSEKTNDTSVIPRKTLSFMRRYGLEPEQVIFDVGGGGRQHADVLRRQGFKVKTVAFGEAATPPPKHSGLVTPLEQRVLEGEKRYAFFNRRAELCWTLRELIDPSTGRVFALPADIINRPRPDGGASLRRQLAVVPLTYDDNGRIYVIPKQRKDPKSKLPSLTSLIGCSPDESDALCMAVWHMMHKPYRAKAGTMSA